MENGLFGRVLVMPNPLITLIYVPTLIIYHLRFYYPNRPRPFKTRLCFKKLNKTGLQTIKLKIIILKIMKVK